MIHQSTRLALVAMLIGSLIVPVTALAAEPIVGLGTASSFAVLGGQTVTNTGATIVVGDLGVSPGTAVTGFPPGVATGTVSAGTSSVTQAQADLTIAYNDAAGRAPTASISGDLGGLTLVEGVYAASSSIGLTGTLTLDAQDDPDAVWVFQIGSTLTTAPASAVSLVNGAQACNVFWQIGSSAALGTDSEFAGTILALTSITVTTGATVDGRILARNGQVSMDRNLITRSDCAAIPETPTPSASVIPTPDDVVTPRLTAPPTDSLPTPSEPSSTRLELILLIGALLAAGSASWKATRPR